MSQETRDILLILDTILLILLTLAPFTPWRR